MNFYSHAQAIANLPKCATEGCNHKADGVVLPQGRFCGKCGRDILKAELELQVRGEAS